jgi:hypothetical protein
MTHTFLNPDDLERQAESAFLAYFSTKEELPGPEWSHITEQLYERWQDLERALCLTRCI